MASGIKLYQQIVIDYPIEETETVRDYAVRMQPELINRGMDSNRAIKGITDSIRPYLPQDRKVKVKRSETLHNGIVTGEKFGFVVDDEIQDKSEYEAKKLTTNPYGGQWVKYEKKEVDYLAEITNLFKGFKFEKIKPFKNSKSQKALKITLADMHVGMSVKENSLFSYRYNKQDFLNSMDLVYKSAIDEYNANGKFDLLIIQDLGDGLDGYNNQTTRGGHALEQDMSNNEAFKTYIEAKLNLINKLYTSNIANKITVKNTVNCNHAGDFGYMANYAIKLACDNIYKDVEIDIYERFIEHFFYGEHCFIQCHGKDKKYMKNGMPLRLNPVTETFINQYIDRYQIKSKFIHFEKGDLHQIGYDCRKKFDYINFMSLAPPSNWVQHNCADAYSGFTLQIIEKDKRSPTQKNIFIEYSEI
jgi:hypothetical protein